ncbi:MAG TPA: hypothetical protein VN540_07000 [Clostridia bacterium]|nr:hypothetical protein [Clostridia bacterium]
MCNVITGPGEGGGPFERDGTYGWGTLIGFSGDDSLDAELDAYGAAYYDEWRDDLYEGP